MNAISPLPIDSNVLRRLARIEARLTMLERRSPGVTISGAADATDHRELEAALASLGRAVADEERAKAAP